MKEQTVILRLETKIKEDLKKLAEKRGSSISQVIRQAVLEHLRKSKKGGDGKTFERTIPTERR